jgi:hypothetical protein
MRAARRRIGWWTLAAGLLAPAACGDGAAPATITINAMDCLESGVNADPFTAVDALAANTADHGDPADFVWNEADVVAITLLGDSATVNGAGAAAVGSTVTITAAGTYRMSGTLTDGQILVDAADALVRMIFDGVSVANAGDAAVFVKKAERGAIILADGSVNQLADGATYPAEVDQNAALFSKADLSIGGGGTLVLHGSFEDSRPLLQTGTTYDLYLDGSAAGTVADGWYRDGTYDGGARYLTFTVADILTSVLP